VKPSSSEQPPRQQDAATEWERFDNAFKRIIRVPKALVLKREKQVKQRRAQRKKSA
jgi:hypothetical protein